MKTQYLTSTFVLVIALCAIQTVRAQSGCAPLPSTNGNRDYLDPANQHHLGMVEYSHLNNDVRMLIRGKTGPLIKDLQYVLNWFPNHHQALDAMVRLAIKENTPTPRGAVNITCRFEWARAVNPRDGVARYIEASYYHKLGDRERTKTILNEALALEPNNANLLYNAGLIYFRMNDYEKSVELANRAYGMGFPLPGLRDMLARAGHRLDS